MKKIILNLIVLFIVTFSLHAASMDDEIEVRHETRCMRLTHVVWNTISAPFKIPHLLINAWKKPIAQKVTLALYATTFWSNVNVTATRYDPTLQCPMNATIAGYDPTLQCRAARGGAFQADYWNFIVGIHNGTGSGDEIHGRRVKNLLDEIPWPLEFSHPIRLFCNNSACLEEAGNTQIIQNKNSESGREKALLVSYDGAFLYLNTSIFAYKTLSISEYLDDLNNVKSNAAKKMLSLPLGVACGLGYLKPPRAIVNQPKIALYGALSKVWQKRIFSNVFDSLSLFVIAYITPQTDIFQKNVFKAIQQSPLAGGKPVRFLIKYANPKAINKKLETQFEGMQACLTSEFIPEEDWHILSQMADISITTGDSSTSDSFFFDHLPLWVVHKRAEAIALHTLAKKISPSMLVHEYLYLLMKYGSVTMNSKMLTSLIPLDKNITANKDAHISLLADIAQLRIAGFIKRIDADFMEAWRYFSNYIRSNYMLTSKKIAAVLDVASSMFTAKDDAIFAALDRTRTTLMPLTQACLVVNYNNGRAIVNANYQTMISKFSIILNENNAHNADLDDLFKSFRGLEETELTVETLIKNLMFYLG